MGTVIATIIVAALSLAGTIIGNVLAHRKSTALIAYRLEQLEEKVDKHNNLVERMYDVENGIKNICYRVEQLERKE